MLHDGPVSIVPGADLKLQEFGGARVSTHLYLADSRYIRRQIEQVREQLLLFESRPDEYGEVMRVGFAEVALLRAAERARKAMRRWDREHLEVRG